MYIKLKQAMRDAGIPTSDGHVLTVPDTVRMRDFFHFKGLSMKDFTGDLGQAAAVANEESTPNQPTNGGAGDAGDANATGDTGADDTGDANDTGDAGDAGDSDAAKEESTLTQPTDAAVKKEPAQPDDATKEMI